MSCAITLGTLLWTAIVERTPEGVRRFVPRALKEAKRKAVSWDHLLLQSQKEEKYALGRTEACAHVISLKRSPYRKRQTIESLHSEALCYTIFDAIDGFDELDDIAVEKYAGRKKRSRLRTTKALTKSQLLGLFEHHQLSGLNGQLRSSLHERLRFGVYMSHVTLWQQIIDRKLPHMLILEDDVVLEDEFTHRLTKLLEQLPKNWGLLYLNGSFKHYGSSYGEHLHQSRGGVGLFGYVISSQAAGFFLSKAALNSDRAIDLMMDNEVVSGRLLAFYATPPLVHIIPTKKSTLAY